ncbi:MAG: YicC family protein [Omnitrophica WOR_2 bacterium RIFCSPHIGHO2_01_FULL_48_9]|nr:MAG: YicC family protein [Omnitrophica WOR_2 bacterium RIFCSPHIGHO2_01_FULL_48_9]
MIKGMTGFGSAHFSKGKIKGVVEIKSLNHRYFDITYYLPPGFGSVEDKIKQLLSKEVDRGRVSVAVKLQQKPFAAFSFNKAAARQYVTQAKALGKGLGLQNDLSLSDIIKLPGVVDNNDTTITLEECWPLIEKSLNSALKSLAGMRKREGQSLARDIQTQLKKMTSQIQQIRSRAKIILEEKRKELVDDEFASFQKSNDVNEEIARLAHYIDELKLLLRAAVSSGKKIDFIAQEMQRETNTIGSKLQDKIVSNAVISLKSKIEKIREQSQNIE